MRIIYGIKTDQAARFTVSYAALEQRMVQYEKEAQQAYQKFYGGQAPKSLVGDYLSAIAIANP